jgi:transcription termination factor Rho
MSELLDWAKSWRHRVSGLRKTGIDFQSYRPRRTEWLNFSEGYWNASDGFGFLRVPIIITFQSCRYLYHRIIGFANQYPNWQSVSGQVATAEMKMALFALLKVEAINLKIRRSQRQGLFDILTPLHPNERFVLEHNPSDSLPRYDLISPIGKVNVVDFGSAAYWKNDDIEAIANWYYARITRK